MIDSAVFIGAIIIAVTQAVKYLVPGVSQLITMLVAVLVGVAVALLDVHIGVVDITVAQGVLVALAAVGVHTTATRTTPPKV
jgi:hypothetical protein